MTQYAPTADGGGAPTGSARRAAHAGTLVGGLLVVLLGLAVSPRLRAQEPTVLASPAAVERLCATLTMDLGADVPPGDPLRRGWSKAQRQQRRDEALAAEYRLVLESEEFHFDDFEPSQAVLPLHVQDGLAPFGERLLLLPAAGEQVPVRLGTQELAHLVEAHASRQVRLQLDFLLDGSRTAAGICGTVRQVTGREVRSLQVIPQTYRWIDREGHLLAVVASEPPAARERAPVVASSLAGPSTAGAPAPTAPSPTARPLAPSAPAAAARPVAGGGPASRPVPTTLRADKNVRVRVAMARLVSDADGGVEDVSLDLEPALAPALLPCLQQRVRQLRHPLEGSLVVDVRATRGGHIEQVWVRRRLLEDEALLRCVLGALRGVALPRTMSGGRGGQRPVRVRIPIFFQTRSQP